VTVPVFPVQETPWRRSGGSSASVNAGYRRAPPHWHGHHVFVVGARGAGQFGFVVVDVMRIAALQRIGVLLPSTPPRRVAPARPGEGLRRASVPEPCTSRCRKTGGRGLYPMGGADGPEARVQPEQSPQLGRAVASGANTDGSMGWAPGHRGGWGGRRSPRPREA